MRTATRPRILTEGLVSDYQISRMTEYRGDGLRAHRIALEREREIEDNEIRKKKLADTMKVLI